VDALGAIIAILMVVAIVAWAQDKNDGRR